MYNKTIIRFGFVISGIIKVSVSVISLSLGLRLITLTSTLIIPDPDITKTPSNNCLKYHINEMQKSQSRACGWAKLAKNKMDIFPFLF